MVNQINKLHQAMNAKLFQYAKKVCEMLTTFESFSVHQIPRDKNTQADLLVKLANSQGVSEVKIAQ